MCIGALEALMKRKDRMKLSLPSNWWKDFFGSQLFHFVKCSFPVTITRNEFLSTPTKSTLSFVATNRRSSCHFAVARKKKSITSISSFSHFPSHARSTLKSFFFFYHCLLSTIVDKQKRNCNGICYLLTLHGCS